jgi:hypothetical protein
MQFLVEAIGVTAEDKEMGVVNDAVDDRYGDGILTEEVMPFSKVFIGRQE